MQIVPFQKRLKLSVFCILFGSAILSVTNSFIHINPIIELLNMLIGLLMGGIIVGFVYLIPGKISIVNDFILFVTFALMVIFARAYLEFFCYLKFNVFVCSTSSLTKATFINVAFPGLVVIMMWLVVRIRFLSLLWKVRH